MKTSTSKGASNGSSDGVLISWRTGKDKVCSTFKDLFQKREKDGDVTIVCSGKFIKAHKLVLTMGSYYFREVLEDLLSRHPTILLKGISFTTMNTLLCCLYYGEVIINPVCMKDFNSAAYELGMFTKDTHIKIRKIPQESQVFKIPQSKCHPKLVQLVNAPAGPLSSAKLKHTHAFYEQRVSPRRNSFEEVNSLYQETTLRVQKETFIRLDYHMGANAR